MLLVELVRTSSEVARTRSRLAKRGLLAEVLRRATPVELELVTTWLSGTLRQRRTGIGWRSLMELPPPAAIATVEVLEVDDLLERASHLEGSGSVTARRDLVDGLFARLTSPEQDFLRNLITGQVRQGALDSVMLDAIAEAADVPLADVRRAAQFSAPTGPVAAAALQGGVDALAAFEMRVGRPVRPMLAASAPDVPLAIEKAVGAGRALIVDTKLDGIRIQVHRDGDRVQVVTRSLDDLGHAVG
ncbi:MAG: ATP-dependent DNA ligase, partial [Myxococcales bacterium]